MDHSNSNSSSEGNSTLAKDPGIASTSGGIFPFTEATLANISEECVEYERVVKLPTSRYHKLSVEELSNIAARIKIFHEEGVVVSDKIIPCRNKWKIWNNRRRQKLIQDKKKRTNTYGKGRVGTSCSAFGVKQCHCCNVEDIENCLNVDDYSNSDVQRKVRSSRYNQEIILIEDEKLIECYSDGSDIDTIDDGIATSSQLLTPPLNFTECNAFKVENNQYLSENGQETSNEEQIMGFVDNFLGSKADTIRDEVEEQYQRLDRYRQFTSERMTVPCYDVLDDDDMVEFVSESSPNPIVVADSPTFGSDLEVVEDRDTLIGESSHELHKRKGLQTASESLGFATNLRLRSCTICLDLLNKEISATTCGHLFCTPCIKKAIKATGRCPNCRNKLTLKKIHPLYL